MSGEEEKKIGPPGRGEIAGVQNRHAAQRTSGRASERARARSHVRREWEMRRYKTDPVDCCQPVQRPDAAAALVAFMRERRSRYSACGTPLLQQAWTRRQTRSARAYETVTASPGRFIGGDSVQDFRAEVVSGFVGRSACRQGVQREEDRERETTRGTSCSAEGDRERTLSSIVEDTRASQRALSLLRERARISS